jgi:hypothetical protein
MQGINQNLVIKKLNKLTVINEYDENLNGIIKYKLSNNEININKILDCTYLLIICRKKNKKLFGSKSHIAVRKKDKNLFCYKRKNKTDRFITEYNVNIEFLDIILCNKKILDENNIIFFEDNIGENILYKRYELNNKIIFIPQNMYNNAIFKYRQQTYFQVCEALGVKSIEYTIINKSDKGNEINANIKIQNYGGDINNKSSNKDETSDILKKEYGICLSQYEYIIYTPAKLEEEIYSPNSPFLINRTDFDNDINLKCLIRSRLNSNLLKSNLSFCSDNISSSETNFNINVSETLGAGYKSHDNKSYILIMNVEFYPLEELISSNNIKYENNNSIQENTRLFSYLTMKVKYDINELYKQNNNNHILELDQIKKIYNNIENYLLQYISSKHPTIKSSILLLRQHSPNEYWSLITNIQTFDDLIDIENIKKYQKYN